MSSSPTVLTSTTPSWTSSPSRPEPTAIIACGAISQPCSELIERHGWPATVYPLPPLLHNQPQQIAGEVERLAVRLREQGRHVVVGYADCGTYGVLDDVCQRLGIDRLHGLHCYDVFAGPDELRALFEADPGTYLLTDFLVRSFTRTVLHELGLDRHPELRDDYFAGYHRVVWLAQEPDGPDAGLRRLAADAAYRIGLPLEVVATSTTGLERELRRLLFRR